MKRKKADNPHLRARDARTGRFITQAEARRRPKTTVTERRRRKRAVHR